MVHSGELFFDDILILLDPKRGVYRFHKIFFHQLKYKIRNKLNCFMQMHHKCLIHCIWV